MTTQEKFRKSPLVLAIAVPFLLVGCFGGSSSSSDDPAEIQLSEQDQVIGAATMGFGFVADAPDEATDEADQDSPEGIQSSAAMAAQAMPIIPGGDEMPNLQLNCEEAGGMSNGSGEGAIRISEQGDFIDMAELDFGEVFSGFDGNVPVEGGDADDSIVRADCEMRDEDGNTVYVYQGAFDIAQHEFAGGHFASFGRIGGYAGPTFGDQADLGDFAVVGGAGGTENRLRSKIVSCEGCDDGDLSTLGGALNAEKNATLAFFTETVNPEFELRVGVSEDDLFINQYKEDSGQEEVTFNGPVRYVQSESGCGFDVTYSMDESQALTLETVNGDEGVPTSGEVDIQPRGSDRMYTVSFTSEGTPTITDDQGNTIDSTPSSEAMECGFLFGAG